MFFIRISICEAHSGPMLGGELAKWNACALTHVYSKIDEFAHVKPDYVAASVDVGVQFGVQCLLIVLL